MDFGPDEEAIKCFLVFLVQLPAELLPPSMLLFQNNTEYNFYDPATKRIMEKIDQIKESRSDNFGNGDVRIYYDVSLPSNGRR